MCRNSNALDLDLARRMRTAGVPMDAGAFAEALVVRQEGGPFANSVALSYLTTTQIGTIIILHIKMIGNIETTFVLSGVELYLPWKDTPINLLPDPADPSAPEIYKFGRYNASQYDKSQVIFQSGKTLRRGQPLEGYLLAVDPEPVPSEIRHRTDVTAKLTIFDQFDQGYSYDVVLRVDRSVEWGPKPVAPKRRSRLFDGPDRKIRTLRNDAEGTLLAAGHKIERRT
jgi:hypothetical protein